jgi:citrate lyase subunit beta/citryl-CoA lyase
MPRRVMLYVPGNTPAMVQNADVFGSDAIIFDLEDSVPPQEKDAARLLVKQALLNLSYQDTETVVRINAVQSEFFQKDLEGILPAGPNALVLPKTEGGEDIRELESRILKILGREKYNRSNIEIIPLIESALGLINVVDIVRSSERITAVQFGAEDFTANIGAQRTLQGTEILFARSQLVTACASRMIQAIDTPFTEVDNEEGLREDALLARTMGFDGKTVISPRHVSIVKQIFSPSAAEVEFARRVVSAFEEAEKSGKGALSVDGKMIDAPIVKRAKNILESSI